MEVGYTQFLLPGFVEADVPDDGTVHVPAPSFFDDLGRRDHSRDAVVPHAMVPPVVTAAIVSVAPSGDI